MSGFFGIFRPQGGPVDLEAFEQMKTAMHREGFDGMETHVEDNIAMGHLMLRVSPESKYDKQPLKSSCGNYILVGHFRLDYRDELGDKLGLTQAELELTPDSQLAMLAYQKWKENCVHHLEGDWAFFVYEKQKNSIFLCKDNFGYSALFYCFHYGSFYFASDGNVLTLISGFKFEINFIELFRISINGLGISSGSTLEKKILYVKNGTAITCSENYHMKELFYKSSMIGGALKYRFEEDYFIEFRSTFSNAVLARNRSVRGSGIFLSSGFDSTAIAFFLNFQTSKTATKLFSFTSYPYYLKVLNGLEPQRVDETIRLTNLLPELSNLTPFFLNFPDYSMVDLLKSNKTKDIFNPLVNYNSFWIDGILQNAHEKGIRQMYVGQFGNFTLSWESQLIYFHSLCSLKLNFIFEYLKASFAKQSFIKFIRQLKVDLFIPFLGILSFLKSLFIRSYWQNILRQSIFSDFLFSDEVLQKKLLKAIKKETTPIFFDSKNMKEYYYRKNGEHLGMKWFDDAHKKAVQMVDPTNDSRFVQYCFSIPESLFNKKGIRRFIYLKSMNGLIPYTNADNEKRCLQAADIADRISSDVKFLNYIKETIFFSRITNNSLPLEIAEIHEGINDPQNKITDKMLRSNKLLKIFSIFEFLKKNQ